MNRLILKYKYPITFAILAVLAWVVYRYFSAGGERAHCVRRRGSHRLGTRHVRFHLFLAAYHVQCLQKSDRSAWARRRPNPRQYAVRGAHSLFARGVKRQLISNRDRRRALRRRLCSTSPKGRRSCTCRTWRAGTTACSSLIRRTARILPTSANAPREPRLAITS